MMLVHIYPHLEELSAAIVQYNTTIKQYSVVINFIRREFVAIFFSIPFSKYYRTKPGTTWINLDQSAPTWTNLDQPKLTWTKPGSTPTNLDQPGPT